MKTHVYLMGLAALLVCSLGAAKARVSDCSSHFQCADNEMCMKGKCGDPCQAWGCGANTECRTTNHFKPTCHCKTGYFRSNVSDYTSDCVECHSHDECPGHEMCVSNKCQDPCLNNICGKNSTCQVRNHHMFCDCVPGQVRADPADVTSNCRVAECEDSSTCDPSKICKQGRCQQSPCNHNTCGPNSQCLVSMDNRAVCTCIPWYQGNPDDKIKGCQPGTPVKSAELSVNIPIYKDGQGWTRDARESSFSLQTHAEAVELTRLWCWIYGYMVAFNMQITVASVNATQAHSTTVTYSGNSNGPVAYDYIWISTEQKPVILSPHTLYTITLTCDTKFNILKLTSPHHDTEHLGFKFSPYKDDVFVSPATTVYYKTVRF